MKSHTMKQLPEEERPYEKCLAYGPEVLTDSELLAVILRSGTRGISSVALASQILEAGAGGEQGLLGIHRLSMGDLMEFRGIGQVKAVQIKCIGELSKRIASVSAKKTSGFSESGNDCGLLHGTDASRRTGNNDMHDAQHQESVIGGDGPFQRNSQCLPGFAPGSDSCGISLSGRVYHYRT